MVPEHFLATVLVVGDDAELCGLLAMNLRQRGFLVEQTSFILAMAGRWEPVFGQPDLVIVDIESTERVPPSYLRRLGERPWIRGAPLLLASDNAPQLCHQLETPPQRMLARSSDVGAVVAAARQILAAISIDADLPGPPHIRSTPA